MENKLDYKFCIRRIEKSNDPDYVAALKVYNETTPYEIKTNTNEISSWLDKKDCTEPFEPMFFALYFSGKLAGFSMMTYLKSQRIVILEYISLKLQYRINTVFLAYINLLENYLSINQYDVSFILNEVSNRRDGHDIDKESQIFSKLLCIEGYRKIDAPYITPPLGTNNHESSFEAYLFVKSSGDIKALEIQTYLNIIKAIYFDYFVVWYKYVLPQNELNDYQNILNKSYESICHKLSTSATVPMAYINCPILSNDFANINTIGLPPTTQKKPKVVIYIVLAVVVLSCPIAIVWIYNLMLGILGIPIDSVGAIVGNCLSTILTTCVTLWITKKKL